MTDIKKSPKSEPKIRTPVSASQLRALADAIMSYGEMLKKASEVAASQPHETIAIFNWKSKDPGLKGLRSVATAADESRLAAELGAPYPVGEGKPRAKPPQTTTDVREKMASKRANKKATKKASKE